MGNKCKATGPHLRMTTEEMALYLTKAVTEETLSEDKAKEIVKATSQKSGFKHKTSNYK